MIRSALQSSSSAGEIGGKRPPQLLLLPLRSTCGDAGRHRGVAVIVYEWVGPFNIAHCCSTPTCSGTGGARRHGRVYYFCSRVAENALSRCASAQRRRVKVCEVRSRRSGGAQAACKGKHYETQPATGATTSKRSPISGRPADMVLHFELTWNDPLSELRLHRRICLSCQ